MTSRIPPAPLRGNHVWDERTESWVPVKLDAFGFPATPERKEQLRRYRNWVWSDEAGNWVPPTPQPAPISDPVNPEWIDTVFVWDDTAAEWVGVSTRPFPSWVRDDKGSWGAPVPMPTEGGPWAWDEADLAWVLVA